MIDPHTGMVSMMWVIMARLLVPTVISTQAGPFGNMLGRVRMHQLGVGVLTTGSIRCGATDCRVRSRIGMVGIASVALLVVASAIPRWVAVMATFPVSGRLPDPLSAAVVQDTCPAFRAAVPLLAIALTRSLLRGGAKTRPA